VWFVGNRYFIIAAAMAAIAAPVTAAPTPPNADADARALLLIPLTLTKVDDLDFGTVVASSSNGSVSMAADGSGRGFTGGVLPVASAPGGRGLFSGAGTAGQQVNLFLAPPTTIGDGNGHSMPISMSLEATTVTIDSSRAFSVAVGGVVSVGANQPDGLYTGTFTVLAQYN
jgi:hypothetical protein